MLPYDRVAVSATSSMKRHAPIPHYGNPLIIKLLVVALVVIAVRRLRVPYTVALVIVGLLITFGQPLGLDLTPDLILALFVPPLVFEATFHIEFRHLRDSLLPILVLAVLSVLLTTMIVGLIVSAGMNIPLTSGLVFGALIAATDPVAFGVVLFTLLVQGTTMQLLLRRIGLVQREEAELEYERRHGRLMTARRVCSRAAALPARHDRGDALGVVGAGAGLADRAASRRARGLLREHPALRAEELDDARCEGLRAQRALLVTLRNDGVVSEHAYAQLLAKVDAALQVEGLRDVQHAHEPEQVE